MKLGDLEFKPVEFRLLRLTDLVNEEAAKIANRILCEKLVNAPEAFANKDVDGKWYKWFMKSTAQRYRARLICIEEIGE